MDWYLAQYESTYHELQLDRTFYLYTQVYCDHCRVKGIIWYLLIHWLIAMYGLIAVIATETRRCVIFEWRRLQRRHRFMGDDVECQCHLWLKLDGYGLIDGYLDWMWPRSPPKLTIHTQVTTQTMPRWMHESAVSVDWRFGWVCGHYNPWIGLSGNAVEASNFEMKALVNFFVIILPSKKYSSI